MSEQELPVGWYVCTLKKCIQCDLRHLNMVDLDTDVSFIPMSSVSDVYGTVVSHEVRKLKSVIKGYSHFIEGDILFAKITPCMENGKIAIASELTNEIGCGSTEFYVLRCSEAIFNKYLWLYLRQDSFRDHCKHNMAGAVGQQRVPRLFLLEQAIPLPPLNEQRRIAAKIEALQARSAKARAALEKARTLLEQYRQSVLASAFRGDLTAGWREAHPDAEPASVFLERIRKERRKRWEEGELAKYAAKGKTPPKDWKKKYPEPVSVNTEGLPELPEGWCWASLDELITNMHNGLSGKPADSLPGIPILRISAVRPFDVNINDVRYYRPKQNEHIENFEVTHGDLLFTRYNGSLDFVGACGIYMAESHILHPDKLIKVTAINFNIAEYISFVSNSGFSKNYIRSQAKSTSGQYGISNGELRQTPIPIPNKTELLEITRVLNLLFSHRKKIKTKYNELTSGIPHLDQSILAKAFRGELVPQDPSDEPASVLLERIITASEAPASKPKPVRPGRKPKSITQ